MLKISPVPWTVYEKTHVMSGDRLVANTGGYSSNVDSDKVIEENIANAQLTVAAPELYKKLKALLEKTDCNDWNHREYYEGRNLLARIRGEEEPYPMPDGEKDGE